MNVSLPIGAAIVPLHVVVQLTVVDAAVVPFDETAIVADAVEDEIYAGRRSRALVELALGTTIRKWTSAVGPACAAADGAGTGTVARPPPPPPHAATIRLHAKVTTSVAGRTRTTFPPPTSSSR